MLTSGPCGTCQSVSLRLVWGWAAAWCFVRECLIHKMPVLVPCRVIEADVLICGPVVWRTIAVVESIRVVIGIFLDSVRPGRSDHEDHHLLFGF